MQLPIFVFERRQPHLRRKEGAIISWSESLLSLHQLWKVSRFLPDIIAEISRGQGFTRDWTCAYRGIEKIFLVGKNVHRNIAINNEDMGATKTDLFTKKQNDMATMAKAIAHPARIAILQYLLRTNACVCGSLVEVLGLAQPTISQHLKELKNAGLIQGTVDGTSVCYCIDPKVWNEYKDVFSGFFKEIVVKEGCC
jgi:DNA-binding transcriptional ArsR family regulator